MTDKNEVALREEAGLPAELMGDLAGLAGQGFEDADGDSYAIPFLRILQALSPQAGEDNEAYVEGAKAGMFINTVTGELYGKSIRVIPVHYRRSFVEWMPERGGFVKDHGPDPSILDSVVEIDDKNNSILENGNIIQDTRNHYVLLADAPEAGPIILSLVSSGIKHSKKWMSTMGALLLPTADKATKAPMFAAIYELATALNTKDNNTWYQIGTKSVTNIKNVGWVNGQQLEAAKAARSLITSGEVEAAYDSTVEEKGDASAAGASSNTKDDEIPF